MLHAQDNKIPNFRAAGFSVAGVAAEPQAAKPQSCSVARSMSEVCLRGRPPIVWGLNKKCPSGRRAADRADPWRARPPVGCCQHNTDSTHRRRKSRFRQRVCPGKGCEAVYTPRTVNQRYCQDQQYLENWSILAINTQNSVCIANTQSTPIID